MKALYKYKRSPSPVILSCLTNLLFSIDKSQFPTVPPQSMSYQMQILRGIVLHGELEKIGIYDQQEIVTLITKYYDILAKMHYFPSFCIKYAPHNPPIDVDLVKGYGLESQVIELLQALPYVEGYSNEDKLFSV
ncbi:hypothetical protein NHQ30_009648 [Ciborinia camelliae]|nr:hypothetical protein NHQ30_009648 [Ciborinia camelliae]